jgi:integration host factor subunit alpha
MPTLTKAQITDAVSNQASLTKTDSAELVETLFELIKQTLENGDHVLITGFGKFSIKPKHERRGRNPATGEPMMLPPRKVATFKCGRVLKDRINGRK